MGSARSADGPGTTYGTIAPSASSSRQARDRSASRQQVRYLALATDYDATLATDGAVDPDTVEALRRLAATGRKLVLVTGRQLDDVTDAFPEVIIFDRVVAENGALLYRPGTRE